MANKISILIQAQDSASKVLENVGKNIDDAGNKSKAAGPKVGSLRDHMAALAGVTAAAGVATHGLIGIMESSIGSADKMQAALTGLNSVARAFGHDADAAKQSAQELASDGLMTVADAATGLKNLLAAGFNLNEATQLMKRFKDSAAFGRQSALSFGQAISSATEGVKNGNSILVDNAGVTRNLSQMLTEAGYSAQDLSKASSDAGVRQAIFNGILKETNAQAGDAAKLADSAAGKQAVWAAQTEILNQKIGLALQPALLALLQVVTPMLTAVAGWIGQNPQLAAGIIIVTTGVLGLITVAGSLALSITALGPVWVAFGAIGTATMGGLSAAMVSFKLLVASPIVMPALAVAAALASIALVIEAINAAKRANDALANAKSAVAASDKAGAELRAVADKKFASGAIGQAEKDRLYGVSRLATGTNYAAGGRTLVGEHGPEIVNMPAGSQVTPAWKTASQGASSGETNVNINGPITFNDRTDIDYFIDRISQTQRLSRLGIAG